MMRVQSQDRLIALGGTLLAFVISACSAGIVAVSRDTLKIYTRGGERLKKDHEVLEETIRGLGITEKASRRIQLRWERAVESARLERQYSDLIGSAGSEEDKQKLRKEAMLRIATLSEHYRMRIEAVNSKVDDEMAQLLRSHETLVKLNGELLKNQEEIHRCLEIPLAEVLRKGIRLDFSPARTQCFVDIGRIEQLIKEGRELVDELKKIRKEREKG